MSGGIRRATGYSPELKQIHSFILAGEAFSPVCFVILFFSRTNFAGLFSFQLLTFVCRTPYQQHTIPQKQKIARGTANYYQIVINFRCISQPLSTASQYPPASRALLIGRGFIVLCAVIFEGGHIPPMTIPPWFCSSSWSSGLWPRAIFFS